MRGGGKERGGSGAREEEGVMGVRGAKGKGRARCVKEGQGKQADRQGEHT